MKIVFLLMFVVLFLIGLFPAEDPWLIGLGIVGFLLTYFWPEGEQ